MSHQQVQICWANIAKSASNKETKMKMFCAPSWALREVIGLERGAQLKLPKMRDTKLGMA